MEAALREASLKNFILSIAKRAACRGAFAFHPIRTAHYSRLEQ